MVINATLPPRISAYDHLFAALLNNFDNFDDKVGLRAIDYLVGSRARSFINSSSFARRFIIYEGKRYRSIRESMSL